MNEQDKEELRLAIEHIFDSGANELRIQEMVEMFIIQRGGLRNPTPEEKVWYKITIGSSGYGQSTSVETHHFTPTELNDHINHIKKIDSESHPMLDLWVKKIERL